MLIFPFCLLSLGLMSGQLSDYELEVGFRLIVLFILAEAWNLLAGYGGMVLLSTASFVGIGSYSLIAILNNKYIPVGIAIFGSGVIAAALVLIFSKALFKFRGLYFSIGTLALAAALQIFMVNYSGFGGASGIVLFQDPPDLKTLFCIGLLLATISYIFISLCTSTRYSILLRAVRDDEDVASQIGIPTFFIKLIALIVAAFLMGTAGALQGLKMGAVDPYGMFGIQWTINTLAAVIIGGQGLRAGPFVGCVFVIFLSELLVDFPAIHMLITGLILIIMIRFSPRGLVGVSTSGCNKLLRRFGCE
jgi:branched-chain amino acid transport system permease protein